MITGQSNYYFRFPEEVGYRLDFVHYHPDLDSIKQFRDSDSSEPFGKSVDTFDYGITDSGKEEGDFKFVNIQNLTEYGEINDDEINFIDSCPDKLKLKENDILISRSRLVGRAAKVTRDFKGEAFGSYIIKFRLSPNSKYLEDFIVKYINSHFGQQQVILLRTGSSGENINSSQLLDIRFPKIEEEKQRQVIEQIKPIEYRALSLMNKFRESLSLINNIFLKELEISLPNNGISYFFKKGKEENSNYYFRFPEIIKDRLHFFFEHPKLEFLDLLGKKYKTVCLKDICKDPIHRGKQPVYSDSGIIVIKTVDLKNLYIDYENALKVSEDFFDSKLQAHIQKNDVLIASTGYVSLGKVDVFDTDELAFADGHISIIRLKKEYDPYFVTYFLRSTLGQLQFEKWFTGSSGQIEVQPADLEKFKIPDIPLPKQRAISNKIKDHIKQAMKYKKEAKIKSNEAARLFENLIAI